MAQKKFLKRKTDRSAKRIYFLSYIFLRIYALEALSYQNVQDNSISHRKRRKISGDSDINKISSYAPNSSRTREKSGGPYRDFLYFTVKSYLNVRHVCLKET